MLVQSWDTAIKAGATHDASACATFYYDGQLHYLLDMLSVKLEYPYLKRLVISHAARFSPEAILMEDKASGQSMLQDLRSETALPLIAVMPKGDKMTRLARVSAMIEAGSVALPSNARWLGGFEQEIMAFPNAAHDDQVDAFSQYLGWVHEKNRRADTRIRRL